MLLMLLVQKTTLGENNYSPPYCRLRLPGVEGKHQPHSRTMKSQSMESHPLLVVPPLSHPFKTRRSLMLHCLICFVGMYLANKKNLAVRRKENNNGGSGERQDYSSEIWQIGTQL
jgi:hypothetical protein